MNHEIKTWSETQGRTLNRLRHPGAPRIFNLKINPNICLRIINAVEYSEHIEELKSMHLCLLLSISVVSYNVLIFSVHQSVLDMILFLEGSGDTLYIKHAEQKMYLPCLPLWSAVPARTAEQEIWGYWISFAQNQLLILYFWNFSWNWLKKIRILVTFLFKKIFFNIYLFLRQRETEHEWGRARERETQYLKQAPGSELSAQSPTRGLNSRTARSWPEPKSDA